MIADLNNDGRGDIAGSAFDGKVSVYAQQGDGTFAAVSGSPYDLGGAGAGHRRRRLPRDRPQRPRRGGAGTHSVAILRNDGGTFTHSEDISLPEGDGAFGLAAGPFNDSDSVPDIAVSSVTVDSGDPLDVFFNFQPPQATTTDATDVTGTNATLNAVVNPLGLGHRRALRVRHDHRLRQPGARGWRARRRQRRDAAHGQPLHRRPGPNTTYHYRVVDEQHRRHDGRRGQDLHDAGRAA